MSRSVREWGTQPSTPCPSWGTYSRASRRPPPQARDVAYLSPPPSCWPSSGCGRRNLTGGMPRCCGLQRAFVSVGSFIPERPPARPRRSSTLDHILHSQMWQQTAGTPPQLFRSLSRPPRPTRFSRESPSTSVCPHC